MHAKRPYRTRPGRHRVRETFLLDGSVVTKFYVPDSARKSRLGRHLGGSGIYRVGPDCDVKAASIVARRGSLGLMEVCVGADTFRLRVPRHRLYQTVRKACSNTKPKVTTLTYMDLPTPVLYDIFFEQVTRLKGLLLHLERTSGQEHDRALLRSRRITLNRVRDSIDPRDKVAQSKQLEHWDQEERALLELVSAA